MEEESEGEERKRTSERKRVRIVHCCSLLHMRVCFLFMSLCSARVSSVRLLFLVLFFLDSDVIRYRSVSALEYVFECLLIASASLDFVLITVATAKILDHISLIRRLHWTHTQQRNEVRNRNNTEKKNKNKNNNNDQRKVKARQEKTSSC